jgi:hypothetical protein
LCGRFGKQAALTCASFKGEIAMMLDKILKRCAVSILIMTSLLASGTLTLSAQTKRKRPTYIVAANTIIRARINETLSSKTAQVGDQFTSTVVTPVYVRGVEVIPAGSIVSGNVTQVTRASRKSQAGSINVAFTSIATPKNNRYAINGSLASSDSADNESGVKGKSSKKRNASFIGRGVVVGGLLGGGSGAVRGGVIGAARGLIKKGEEAEIKPGTEFNLILNRSVSTYAFR